MRLDRDLIKQQIQWHWPGMLGNEGITLPLTPTQKGKCPICRAIKLKFKYDDLNGNGTYICSRCGAGDGFSLLMKCFDWTFPQALEAVHRYLNGATLPTHSTPPKPTQPIKKFNANKQRKIKETIRQSAPTGEPGGKYLANRGVGNAAGVFSSSLRFHASLPYTEQAETGKWVQLALCPAMIGLVTNLEGKVITLHRTFLTQNGEKAPYANPKKLMSPAVPGSLRGCSIKLGEPTDQLCLTEGIETALAVWLSTDIPTWACISANLLEAVEVPLTVKKINIMADKDRSLTGQRSAEKLARRLTKLGHEVRICLPADEIPDGQKGLDWLDVFNRDKEVAA